MIWRIIFVRTFVLDALQLDRHYIRQNDIYLNFDLKSQASTHQTENYLASN